MLVYQRVLLLNSTSAMENPRGLPTENDENKLCQAASQSEAQAQALDCETSGVKCQIWQQNICSVHVEHSNNTRVNVYIVCEFVVWVWWLEENVEATYDRYW